MTRFAKAPGWVSRLAKLTSYLGGVDDVILNSFVAVRTCRFLQFCPNKLSWIKCSCCTSLLDHLAFCTTKRTALLINLFQVKGGVSDVTSKSRSFPQVDRTDFQCIQLSRLISPVNGVRFCSGKKCCVSDAKDFDQAQYLKWVKSPILSL